MEKEWRVMAFRISKCFELFDHSAKSRSNGFDKLLDIFPMKFYQEEKTKRIHDNEMLKEKVKEKREKIKQLEEFSERLKKSRFERKIRFYKNAYDARNSKLNHYREMANNKPIKVETQSRLQLTLKTEPGRFTDLFELTGIDERAKTPNPSKSRFGKRTQSTHRYRFKSNASASLTRSIN
ncbi:unnamed protein product [Blepharisma stoltei]|uniref:Uncharacterized protein n=1 Tax=Blepharisma stoltei TaxID=1481888 RepID=A0AAU9JV97_9CILI|nr:unnamed protein product [Blepharisma stoltei]